MLAGRKKRNISGDVAAAHCAAPPTKSSASDCVVTNHAPSKPTSSDSTAQTAKCREASCSATLSENVKSCSAVEDAGGTVAKVAERRKSELTLTIKCSRAKDESSDDDDDEDEDDDDDDDDDSDSLSSSSNSEDEMMCSTKRLISSSIDRKSGTKLPAVAKTANKKQTASDSDDSEENAVGPETKTKRNIHALTCITSPAGTGSQTSTTVSKRKKSTNSQSPSCKRRRSSSNNQVGCE